MLARKQMTYTILEEDDDADDNVPVAPSPKKEETRRKKFRKRSEPHDDIDDEVVKSEGKERRVKSRTSRDEDDGSEVHLCLHEARHSLYWKPVSFYLLPLYTMWPWF